MPLMENLKTETVSRLALRDPVVTTAEATIRSVIEQMREKNLGCAIAVDEDRRPLGMFTEAMLTNLLTKNPAIVEEPLANHLAEQWPWVKQSDPIVDVLEALELKNTRFLCVVDEEGRLCGLTGQKSLMEYVAEHFPNQATVQRIGGRPYPHAREGA